MITVCVHNVQKKNTTSNDMITVCVHNVTSLSKHTDD